MFLKLSNMIINTRHIRKILIQPNKFYIYTTKNGANGFMIMGNGGMITHDDFYEICRETSREDFFKVSSFITQIKD
jgi:hypothetical protein